MKIHSINTISTNHAINSNAQHKTFKGLWGDTRDTGTRDYSFGFDILQERDYHPFSDESEVAIADKLRPGSELEDSAQGVYADYTVRRGVTLPIKEAEYELYIKSPNSLSYERRSVIRQVEKALSSGKGRDYIERTIRNIKR